MKNNRLVTNRPILAIIVHSFLAYNDSILWQKIILDRSGGTFDPAYQQNAECQYSVNTRSDPKVKPDAPAPPVSAPGLVGREPRG